MNVQSKCKRCVDVSFALVILAVLFPLLIIIGILVKITSRGPIIFRQKRLGYKGKIFILYKFRSMTFDKTAFSSYDFIKNSDARITGLGKILRLSHFDEVPQFFNVLKGDMSLVGPRPTFPFHFSYYKEWEKKRLSVLPGLTGWAQINGGTSINWDQRIKLDVWYVKNRSLSLDITIIMRTLLLILLRVGQKHREELPPNESQWTRGCPERIELYSK